MSQPNLIKAAETLKNLRKSFQEEVELPVIEQKNRAALITAFNTDRRIYSIFSVTLAPFPQFSEKDNEHIFKNAFGSEVWTRDHLTEHSPSIINNLYSVMFYNNPSPGGSRFVVEPSRPEFVLVENNPEAVMVTKLFQDKNGDWKTDSIGYLKVRHGGRSVYEGKAYKSSPVFSSRPLNPFHLSFEGKLDENEFKKLSEWVNKAPKGVVLKPGHL
jgi:hypothetical protein